MNRSRLFVAVSALAGCTSLSACSKPSSRQSDKKPNFELVCDSTDTRDSATLFCIRHDTRDGDVQQVAVNALPRSKEATATEVGQPGSYTLRCQATRTAELSDLFCVRLNTQTGDMLLIALPKIGIVPVGAELVPMVTEAGAAAHEHGPETHTPPPATDEQAAPPKEAQVPSDDEAPPTEPAGSHIHGGRAHTHAGGDKPHQH